jgi:Anti-sigma-K factor rskA
MDLSKLELPELLRWATTVVLAAMTACLAELWTVQKERNEVLRDQSVLTETALKTVEDQLEAERIVSRREAEHARDGGKPREGYSVAPLLPPGSSADADPSLRSACGVVVWSADGRRGLVSLSGLPTDPLDRDLQLWMVGRPGTLPRSCGVFKQPVGADSRPLPLGLSAPVAPGCRFLLIRGKVGGAPTLSAAEIAGSIILATPPVHETINP